MNGLQDFFVANVPAPVLAHLTQHSSTYWRIYQQIWTLQKTVFAWTAPILDKIRESPDLMSILLLLGILILSLKLLGMLFRTVVSWIRFSLFVIKWATLIFVGAWIWQRGFEGTIDDATNLVQSLYGIWNKEYTYWQEQDRVARAWNQRSGGSGGPWRARSGGRWT